MSDSFASLSGETRSQRESMSGLLQGLGAGQQAASRTGMAAFAAETKEVLAQFADMFTAVSTQSLRTVYRIDDMAEELDEVFKLVASINEIADETFILAVNATIEAAHAGNAGRSFSVIAGNVRELSKKTQRFNDQIGAQVAKTRGTVRELRDIISEMASHDMTVALAEKERVESMMAELETFERMLSSALRQATANTERIDSATSEAITALQGGDILSQLFASMLLRLARVAELTGCPVPDLHDVAGAVASIAGVSETRNPVHQRTLEAGGVKFF